MVVNMEVPQTLGLRALISSVLVGAGGYWGKIIDRPAESRTISSATSAIRAMFFALSA